MRLLFAAFCLFNTHVVAATDDSVAPYVDMASRRMHPPRYPKGAIEQNQSGKLLLKVLVSVEGRPLSIEIEHASPPEAAMIFGDAAKAAIMQWTYHAGTKGGKPYAGFVFEPIDFSLAPPGGICLTDAKGHCQ
jgi:protein TonB